MTDATCSIDECDRRVQARTWCRRHYERWRLYSDPLGAPPPKPVRTCTIDECGRRHRGRGFCGAHYTQWWYHSNVERAKAQQSGYRAARREYNRERTRRWREQNPGKAVAMCRNWSRRNGDRIRENKRRYRTANRDKIRALNAARRARQVKAPINDLTARQWHEIKVLYRHCCAYCHQRKPLTMDHVIPLARGGAHTASNVVPACQPCNSQKNVGPPPIFQPLLI